jgi:uncharacterized damage-inducible protein DinB
MPASAGLVLELNNTLKFFKTTISIFDAGDATFAPQPDLYTVAGHIAHVADSVDWFVEGGFGKGWDMDFAQAIAKAKAVTSLDEAKAWLERAFAHAVKVVGQASDATLFEPIPDARIMEGAPRLAVVSGVMDHTAHHRGALSVYARLLGKVAPMPYA